MVRLARALPWALSILLFVVGTTAAPAAKTKRRSAARCVRYSQAMDPDESGVTVTLRNQCRFAVSCSIEWTLRCDGKRADPESTALDVEPGATGSARASAAACHGEWKVDVRWRCDGKR